MLKACHFILTGTILALNLMGALPVALAEKLVPAQKKLANKIDEREA